MRKLYFNDENYPVNISESTHIVTPNVWHDHDAHHCEPQQVKYFFDNLPKDQKINVLDIGAQSGLYSIMSKYVPLAQFHSFEPFPKSYEVLIENIKINEINNVKTYNIGLSDEIGEAILNTSASHNGLHTIGSNPLRFSDIVPIKIKVDTIDNIFYDNQIPVHFMKIDTEGWEYHILKGAKKTIEKYRPKLIQLEWNETNMAQCGVDPQDVRNLFDELGYVVKCILAEEMYIEPK